ncbi:MAG: sigma-70 family RNA polymerase sigma factor [Chloroflexi bacterium]|nr:sigma-70 family RNA polymerase sigma factor [Chloroflexota bacterium]
MPSTNSPPAISLDALRSGDPQALAALFEAYADRIYRLALSLLRDPSAAEDIVQETFVSAMTHLDRFEGRSSLGTWLYRVGYNASLDWLRRRRDEPLPPDEPGDESEAVPLPRSLVEWRLTPESRQAEGEMAAELDRAIGELSESLRLVFLLRDVDELSTQETAEALGLTEGAVKVRLHRARLALREKLSDYFTERTPQEGEAA